MSVATEAAVLAREAAQQIQFRGLAKHQLVNYITGAVCLHGAIMCAQTGRVPAMGSALPDHTEPHERICEVLAKKFHDPHERWPGSDFNDKDDTTVLDVAKALLEVADTLDFE